MISTILHTLGTSSAIVFASAALAFAAGAQEPTHRIDVGTPEDEQFIREGIYQQEGLNPRSRNEFYRENSMRWFSNRWVMNLPVFARRNNEVILRARFGRSVRLEIAGNWQVTIQGAGDEQYEYRFVIPKEAIGEQERVEVRGRCDPPYEGPPGTRDSRELAMAVDAFVIRPVGQIADDAVVARRVGQPSEERQEHFVNLGLPGDEEFVGQGIYHREGPTSHSKDPIARYASFRWFANRWTLEVPVFPDQHNEIVIRGRTGRPVRVAVGRDFSAVMLPAPGPEYENRLFVPAATVGDRSTIELRGETISPPEPSESRRDRRELALLADWVRVRPVDDLPAGALAVQTMPREKEPELPLAYRLRGTEMRPLVTDVDPYVVQARLMRCNVMTIGPMNGQHYTAFPTEHGTPYPEMRPDFIPNQVDALHAWGIAAIGWLPYNVQDLRAGRRCMAAEKHPEWRMEYLEWPDRPGEDRVGMCVVSSPWRQMHAEILKEAAATGLDGVFFDGFYLGGIPHPIAPGCVCRWCRESFHRETGLEAPGQIDWTDPVFKRWVRWRNDKLIEVARFFRDTMRQANSDLHVTCNWNIWPFGTKDWETAIPLWAVDDLGTSQHAYTGRTDLEWLIVGFKSRLSHDLNPSHSDIWRTSRPAFHDTGSEADRRRHELTMRTFMLAALTYGTTPWHGGHIAPPDVGIRVHEAVRARERFFSQDTVRHVGVVLSQNTHDFYGHLPGTTNLEDYRDTILGAWLLLTERHVPFRFVFDNQINREELATYKVLLLPNTACLSDAMAGELNRFADGGGRLIATGAAGEYDEWAGKRKENALAGADAVRLEGSPALQWLRTRNERAAKTMLAPIRNVPAPVTVEAPRSVAVNAAWAPGRKAVWVHMLNASAFYTNGDTGFRGMDREPVYPADVEPGDPKRINVPAKNVVVRAPGLNVKEARLGVAGEKIVPRADGEFVVPKLDVHDVLILELNM